jgi:multicomponent Na+:H+ antiporter subunit E
MNRVFSNVLLALAWVLMTATVSVENFIAGLLLGALMISLLPAKESKQRYGWKLLKVLSFLGYFAVEVVKANLRLIRFVLGPITAMRPAIVRVPVDLNSDLALTILANVITLTPGTLSLDIPESRDAIFVHVIDTESAEALRREVTEGFARRVKEIVE